MKIFQRIRERDDQQGFTLLECVIALVVTLIGVLAVFVLITYSVQMHVTSRNTATANTLAKAKVEELKNSNRVIGGDLNSNVTGYFDTPAANIVRRWQVTAGPQGSETVAVRMISNNPGVRVAEVTLVTRMR